MALGIKKSKVHSAPAHADEKWLVSYSDLMTLLFGFFVLMYSLASENKGKTEDVLEGISKQMRGISSEEKKDPQAEIADLKKKIDEYKKEFLALDKINNDQLEEIDRLKTSLAEIDKEKKKLESTLPDPSRSKDQSSLIDKLNKEIERLKKAYADLFAKSQIWIFAEWNTEKHDVDLTIKNPQGQIYNFKNRSFKGVPGELILDSRYGPGAEVWVSDQLVPGRYEVKVTLYNQYGNVKDTSVRTTIMVGVEKLKLPELKLNLNGQSTMAYNIEISKDGKITLL